jgi:hypothetical protein
MRSKIISLLKRLPSLRDVASELADLRPYRTWVPPGHFHSPIPSPRSIDPHVLEARPRQLPAVDLIETGQLALLSEFAEYYREVPWSERPTPGLRYYFNNDSYWPLRCHLSVRHDPPHQTSADYRGGIWLFVMCVSRYQRTVFRQSNCLHIDRAAS